MQLLCHTETYVRSILQKVHADLNALSDKVKEKVASGEFPDIKYTCVLREGIPEEEVLRYTKEYRPRIIIMGTRGKSQKDIDLIGSVTAEVIDDVKHEVVVSSYEASLVVPHFVAYLIVGVSLCSN